MERTFESAAARLEKSIVYYFTPSGLLTAVFLIVLSILLFSGAGIERRTMESPDDYDPETVSPILDTVR